jgi:hypothetical protein
VVLVEDAPYLGGMVLDPEVASDNLGHPGLGPDVAAKAKGLGSLGQQFQQLGPLLVGQLGPPALARRSHWLTAPLVTPRASAMRCWVQPFWNSSQARRRRPSHQFVACWERSAVIHYSMPAICPDV